MIPKRELLVKSIFPLAKIIFSFLTKTTLNLGLKPNKPNGLFQIWHSHCSPNLSTWRMVTTRSRQTLRPAEADSDSDTLATQR